MVLWDYYTLKVFTMTPTVNHYVKKFIPRLKYHFQFRNELKLFAEVGDRFDYGIHIYSGNKSEIFFIHI
jgi:hypothetical protein